MLCPIDQLAQLTNWPKFYGQYVNSDSLINWSFMYWPEMPNAYTNFQGDSWSGSTYSTKYIVIYFLLRASMGCKTELANSTIFLDATVNLQSANYL